MKIFKSVLILFLVGCTSYLTAQTNSSTAYAESNQITDTKKYIGTTPMPFQAADMKGKNHFLPDYKGKVVVMAFWSAADELSRNQIKSLNQLQKEFSTKNVVILSLADEDKPDLNSFLKNNAINYPVIPNARPLGEIGYGSDLGTSRIYIVNEMGKIEDIYITEDESGMQTYHDVKDIVNNLLK